MVKTDRGSYMPAQRCQYRTGQKDDGFGARELRVTESRQDPAQSVHVDFVTRHDGVPAV